MGFSPGLMSGLLNANSALNQAQMHQRTASHLDSRAHILESEIKSGYGDIEGKKAELEDVQEQQIAVQEMQTKSLNEASSALGTSILPEENAKDDKDKTEKSDSDNNSTTASQKASDEAKKLQDRVSDQNIAPVDYEAGMQFPKDSAANVAVSPDYLEKAADDSALSKACENRLVSMAEIDASAEDKNASTAAVWSVDSNGQISRHTTYATAEDAAASEQVRTQADQAAREAFGDTFLGTRVHIETSLPPERPDSLGLLVSTTV